MTPNEEKLKKLQELRDKRAGSSGISGLIKNITVVKGDKGEPGYTPVRGKDYYTAQEIDFIIQHIQSQVKPGMKGDPGIQGDPGSPGKPGYTPQRGVDYWLPKDQEKILQSVLAKIPKSKDGISPDINEVVNKAVDELKKKPINLNDITGAGDLRKLIEFLKVGGFRGGGNMMGVYTDKITLSKTAPANPKFGDLWYNIT
jgi:hypothetical protein